MKDASNAQLRFFSRADFEVWLDVIARKSFGMSGKEFVVEYENGRFRDLPIALNAACVIPLITTKDGKDSTCTDVQTVKTRD